MKSGILLLFITAALSAQEGPGFGRGRGFGRGPAVGFTALDADQDGVISAKEIAVASVALRKLDKNGDGQLTEEEVRPNFGGRGEGRGEGRGQGRGPEAEASGPTPDELVQTLMAFDKNKDGKIAKAELPERMQGMFDRGDKDKDGFLTADEIRGMAAAQTAPGGGREGGGEGRRGGPGGGMMRFDPILAAVDADHDGTLSAAEIQNAPAALKALDKNNDGQITRDEATPAFGGGRGGDRQGPPQRF